MISLRINENALDTIIIAKYASIVIVSLLALFLGSMATAWRRACVYITKEVYPFDKLNGENIEKFTPRYISQRNLFSVALLILSGLMALIFINWMIALVLIATNYILMILFAYLFPNKQSEYYLSRVEDDFITRRNLYKKFNDTENEQEMQKRLDLLYKAFRPNQ